MNKDIFEGNWKQLKGKVQQQWGKLTDDDLDVIDGKRTELAGKLQERYGYGKDEAEKRGLAFDKENYIQFAVKADGKTKYNVLKHVIQVFREAKVKNFQMITGLEAKPND